MSHCILRFTQKSIFVLGFATILGFSVAAPQAWANEEVSSGGGYSSSIAEQSVDNQEYSGAQVSGDIVAPVSGVSSASADDLTTAKNADSSASAGDEVDKTTSSNDSSVTTDQDKSANTGSADAADNSTADGSQQTNNAGTASSSASTATATKDTTAASNTVQSTSTAKSAPVAKAAAKASTNKNQTIKDGTYIIQSALGQSQVIDVQNGSTKNGANVQLYESNMTDAQKWKIFFEKDGYYSIKNILSGKYLDLSSAAVKNSQNIQQYSGNSTKAQRWLIVSSGSGYKIVSALNSNYVIDVAGANSANGANVQLYKANGSNAQVFYFISVSEAVEPGDASVASGVYVIKSAGNNKYVLDVESASYGNSANVQIYQNNDTTAQRWYVSAGADGFYTIKNIASGKALDVKDGNVASGMNVWQYAANGTNAQKWGFQKNADGTYTLINALSGMVLDVYAGSFKNSSNVQVWHKNGSVAQNWVLTKASLLVDKGLYTLYSYVSPTSKVLDIPSGSTSSNTQVQIYTYNGSSAQKFRVVSLGDDKYTFQSLASGLYLTNSNGKVVQSAKVSNNSQTWVAKFVGAGIQFTSLLDSSSLMKVSGASNSNGAKMVVGASDAAAGQRFRVISVDAIENGYYIIRNANGKVIDVADGGFTNGKNIQMWSSNGSGAQVFYIQKRGSYYSIQNARSLKVLDVKNGSTANGANVQQYAYNGSNAQLWSVELDENCNIIFKNKGDQNKVLDISSNSSSNGANVDIYTKNGTSAQQWRLTQTTKYSTTGDTSLDQIIAKCWDRIGEGGDQLRKAYNWVASFPYYSGSKYPSGNWSVPFAKQMYNNGGGNCYRYAALFCWLAKSIGYNANVVSGWVVGYTEPQAPHGWVEIHMNGRTYTCDPDMQHEISYRNWYLCTYATSPTEYHFW